jgi:hypothetical protein
MDNDRKYAWLVKAISDVDMAKLNITPHETHPKWNYTILPQKS